MSYRGSYEGLTHSQVELKIKLEKVDRYIGELSSLEGPDKRIDMWLREAYQQRDAIRAQLPISADGTME